MINSRVLQSFRKKNNSLHGFFLRTFIAMCISLWIFTFVAQINEGSLLKEQSNSLRGRLEHSTSSLEQVIDPSHGDKPFHLKNTSIFDIQKEHKDNDQNLSKIKTIQAHRKKILDNACAKRKQISGKVGEISGYRNGGISYCLVQKAGCTSWARIFRFLNGEKSIKKTPMDISKFETHNARMNYFKFFHLKNKEDKMFVERSTRVMTVRDPYARLWSAYIDKFLLPDFWTTKGKEIIRRVRKNATIDELRCGSDVTFKEFIAYVVDSKGKVRSWGQDKHWIPAAAMCDPCVFKPKYVAKQETLSRDMKLILNQLKLDWVLNRTTNIDRTEYELIDQTDYVFNIYKRHMKCATKLKFCKLMWQAYQLNGYIPFEATFPEDQLEDADKKKFLELLTSARLNWHVTKAEKRKIKRKAMVDGFKTISKEHLKQLQDIYKDDLSLFEYEREPKDIFS